MKLNEAIETQSLDKLKQIWSHIDKVLLTILVLFLILLSAFSAVGQDVTPPTISSLSPANEETGVALDVGTLTLTLSETVVANTELSETYDEIRLRTISGTVIQEFEIDEVTQVGISGNVVTLKNVQTLAYGQTYYIQCWSGGPGMFKDLAGNKLADFNNNTTWRFTTRASDLYIVSTYPADGATFVDPRDVEDFTITFNQDVFRNYTWWLQIRDSDDTDRLGFSTTYTTNQYMEIDGNTVTLKRRDIDLPYGEDLHFYIPPQAFKDANNRNFEGIAWGDHTTWNFTTKSEVTPPQISSLDPAHEEEGVDPNQSVFTIRFNETVSIDRAGYIELYLKTKSGATLVDQTDPNDIVYNKGNYQIPFDGHDGLIAGGQYYISIGDNIFHDAQENYFTGTNVDNWSFLVNRNPTSISLNNNTVDENQEVGTVVGSFSVIDPDQGDNTTVAFISGTGSTDNASFQIVGKQLQTAVELDYEAGATRSIRVRATDNAGGIRDQILTINVGDVDDTPPQVLSRYPDENTVVDDTQLEYIEVEFDENIAFTTDGFDRGLKLYRDGIEQDSWYDAGEGQGPANSYIVDGNKLRFPLDPIYCCGSTTTMLLERAYTFGSFAITDLHGNQVIIPSIAFTTRDYYTGNDILTFTAAGIDGSAVIDAQNHTIAANMLANSTLAVDPVVTLSQNASCLPLTNDQELEFVSGESMDFVVRAENGDEVTWAVTLTWPAMAGEFLIGSGGDFEDLETAFVELESRGMSGDVIFSLMDGHVDSKYGFTYFGKYEGSDTYNTTITVEDGATSATISNYLMYLEGVQNMTFDGKGILSIDPYAGNNNFVLRDNDSAESCQNITFKNLIARSGQGFAEIIEADNVLIEGNQITIEDGSSGLRILAGSANVSVTKNKFYLEETEIGSSSIGIAINSTSGTTSIINNVIHLDAQAAGVKLTGIYITAYENAQVVFNTITSNGTYTGTNVGDQGISMSNSNGMDAEIKNNLFQYTGTAKYSSYYYYNVGSGDIDFSFNNFDIPFNHTQQYYVDAYYTGTKLGDGDFDEVLALFPNNTESQVIFTDKANGDYSLTGASTSNHNLRGTPIDGVETDILGANRSNSAPSKGAYEVPNRASDFITFSIPQQVSEPTINTDNHTVAVSVNAGTSLTNLVPTFTISPGASIDKASGDEQDFTTPVSYLITDEQEYAQQEWVVTVSEQNLAPTDIALDPSSIDENEEAGTVVGVLSGTDPNGDELVFSIIGGDGGQHGYLFEIDADGTTLKSKAPFDFEQNEELYVRIEADDQAGETYQEALVIDVLDVDEIAPVLLSASPTHETTGVALYAEFSLTYDENIVANPATYQLRKANTQLVETLTVDGGGVVVTDNVVTLTPSSNLLYNTDYYIQALAGTVTDELGNPAPEIAAGSWAFTTVDLITSFSPADEATEVSPFVDLVITFGEPVALQTGGVFRMFRKADDVQVGVDWSFNGATADGSTVTFDIPENLEPDVEIYINILGGIEDAQGNPIDIMGKDTWNFTPVIQDQTVTLNPIAAKTYGADPFAFTPAAASSGEPIDYTSSNTNVATVDGNTLTIVGAGETTIRATQAGNTYYNPAYAEQIFTVNKAPQSISFLGPANMTYGDANHVLNGSITPSDNDVTYEIISGDAVVIDQEEFELVIVGTGDVTIRATGEETANYLAPNAVDRSFTVYKKTITATADDKTKVYGEVNPEFTISYEGLIDGEDDSVIDTAPDFTTLAVINSDVGFYEISLDGGLDDNYALNLSDGQLEITKKSLVVSADAKSRAYGESNPEFSLSFEGFIDGDDEGDLLGALPSTNTTADESSPVGDYTITVTDGTDANYEFQNENGILSITPAEIEVFVQSAEKNYGEDNPDFEIELEGFKNGETEAVLTTQPIASTSANKYSNAGVYEITAAGAEADNYTFDYDPASFIIHKIALTATAVDASKVYGEPIPDFDIEYTGFIDGENEFDLDEVIIAGTVATQTSHVGTYDISLSETEDTNYEITTVTGTLTITKAEQIISIEDITDKVKNAGPFDVVASVNSGAELNYAVSGPATNEGSTITLTGALGTVTVTVSAAESLNYTADSEQVSFEVNDKEAQTISFTIGDQTYGGEVTLNGEASSELTVTYGNLSGPISLAGNVLTMTGVGEASITAYQAGDEVYNEAEPEVVTFSIAKANLTVTAHHKSKIYGEAHPELTFEYDGFVLDDDAEDLDEEPTISTVEEDSDAGIHSITLSGGADDNYELTLVNGELTIEKANPVLSIADIADQAMDSDPFGIDVDIDSDQVLSYLVSGPASVSNDGLVTLDGETGEVEITVLAAANTNYHEASETVSFSVFDNSLLTQTITIESIDDKLTTDEPFDVVASSTSELEVALTVSGPATIAGTTITLDGTTGTVTVTGNQAGNEEYAAAEEVNITFEVSEPAVEKQSQTITLATIEDKLTTAEPFEVEASASSELEVELTVTGPATIAGTTITLDGTEGTVTVFANQPGDDNFESAEEVSISFEVSAPEVLAVLARATEVKVYPNPATEWLALDGVSLEGIQVQLINMNGRIVKAQKVFSNDRIEVSDLESGLYMLQTSHNDITTTTKILIH